MNKLISTTFFILAIAALSWLVLFSLSSENYSNGECIGVIGKFEKSGLFPNWKSWGGELHITQTGMNSNSNNFLFSVDNDKTDNEKLSKLLDSAANRGWKIKLIYHQVFLENWFGNRGSSNNFVDKVVVLDRNIASLFTNKTATIKPSSAGCKIDTIYIPRPYKKHKLVTKKRPKIGVY